MPVSFYSELAAARLPLSSPMTSLADKDMWRKFMTIDCDTCAPLRSDRGQLVDSISLLFLVSLSGPTLHNCTVNHACDVAARQQLWLQHQHQLQSQPQPQPEPQLQLRLRCLLSGNKLVSCLYWLWLRLGVMRPICLPFHIDFYFDCDCDCDCYPSCWNSKICAQ